MKYIVYSDEVGYGAWAGPVVVCSLLAPAHPCYDVKDSKMLTAKERRKIFDYIVHHYDYCVCWSDAHEIDKYGLRHATDKALKFSWDYLYSKHKSIFCGQSLFNNAMDIILDGKYIPQSYHRITNLINGDKRNQMIAYASIVAKEIRDRLMIQIHKTYPKYCWNTNVGYGTKKHFEAINLYGITQFHRRSYKPIAKLISDGNEDLYI
ncbi:MAG: ribonuclease HII [Alphaproteobacteria bacterium]|nr:MAG: ribonuclease HII [Alphaproteobacteria bacterium]